MGEFREELRRAYSQWVEQQNHREKAEAAVKQPPEELEAGLLMAQKLMGYLQKQARSAHKKWPGLNCDPVLAGLIFALLELLSNDDNKGGFDSLIAVFKGIEWPWQMEVSDGEELTHDGVTEMRRRIEYLFNGIGIVDRNHDWN